MVDQLVRQRLEAIPSQLYQSVSTHLLGDRVTWGGPMRATMRSWATGHRCEAEDAYRTAGSLDLSI